MLVIQMDQKAKRKKQFHVNSIIKQFKLCQQLYAEQKLKKQQKSLRKFEKSRRLSVVINNLNIIADVQNNIFNKQKQNSNNINTITNASSLCQSKLHQSKLLNNFMNKNQNKKHQNSKFRLSYQTHHKSQQNKNKLQQQNKKINKQTNLQKDKNKQNVRKYILNKSKYRKKDLKNNLVMSSINTKIRQLSLISKTFDKINENYDYQLMLMDNRNQRIQLTNTQLVLKQFKNNLSVGNNLVTQRKNELKRNIKHQFRYKANINRYQTEANQKNSTKINCHQTKQIWLHDANKLKSYIMGGYHDQRQQFSNTYDIDDFRKLKKNFQSFDQICNEIKEDTFNSISTLKAQKLQIQRDQNNKHPNVLKIVSVMQKQQQVNKYLLY